LVVVLGTVVFVVTVVVYRHGVPMLPTRQGSDGRLTLALGASAAMLAVIGIVGLGAWLAREHQREPGPRLLVRSEPGARQASFTGYGRSPFGAAAQPPGAFGRVRIGEFTGRNWLRDRLDAEWEARQSGYALLEADAGLGKTAFAAWLVRERGYVAHFVQRGDSRATLASVQRSLGTQVVSRFQLEPWSTQAGPPAPEEVSGVIEAAARQLDGDRLVIVVDGWDEADPEHGQPIAGLPPTLPDGVFVLATYRTGTPVHRPAGSVHLTISARDEDNSRDVRRFLSGVTSEEWLAAKLNKRGVPAHTFIDMLAERTGGVWIYQSWVLEEIRHGNRQVDHIDGLPADLAYYYLESLYSDGSADWSTVRLPLLSTLAAAGEPMPVEALTRLSGIADARAVGNLCDTRYRPFLEATGQPRHYSINHASVREFLQGRGLISGEQAPDRLAATSAVLAAATHDAHDRIATWYLDHFGGPKLSRLAKNPALVDIDGGYGLRHLVTHLIEAGRTANVHRLLASDSPGRGGRKSVNLWFDAHDRVGSLDAYLDDVRRAQAVVRRANDADLAHRRVASKLGLEVRYTLITASTLTRSSTVPVPLLQRLVSTGRWDTTRAVSHARQIPQPYPRSRALIGLLPHMMPERRAPVLGEAFHAAEEAGSGRALDAVLENVPHDMISDALAAIAATPERWRAHALAALSQQIPAEQLQEALGVAKTIEEAAHRSTALAALVPRLPARQQEAAINQALRAATNAKNEGALASLVPYLAKKQPRRAVAIARAIDNRYVRATALAALASHLPPREVRDALEAATAMMTGMPAAAAEAVRAIAALASKVPLHQRHAIIEQALQAATASRLFVRGSFRALAPHLTDDQLHRALTFATTADNEYTRADTLAELAEYLPPTLLGQALEAATTLESEKRVRVLVALIPRLPVDLIDRVFQGALEAPERVRGHLLSVLAPHLPSRLHGQAVSAAATIAAERVRGGALSALIPQVSESLVEQALEAAVDIADADTIARLALALPNDERRVLVERALGCATAGNQYSGALALEGLAPLLPADLLKQAVESVAVRMRGYYRRRAIEALAPHLPDDLLPHALAAGSAIDDNMHRVQALASLALHVRLDERRAVLEQVLEAADAADGGQRNRQAFEAIAPVLPADLVERAVGVAVSTLPGRDLVPVLATFARHFAPDQLGPVLAAGLRITDDNTLAGALWASPRNVETSP
jgi:hypothetical protein